MDNTGINFWKMRHVFVTGGTGLLGGWLIDDLLSNGARVTCLVRDWVPASRLFTGGSFQRVNIVRGELEDYGTLVRILSEYEIESVFHLAAETTSNRSSSSPLSVFNSNIRGTWNILEACRSLGEQVQRIIIASSAKAYGPQSELPCIEDTPLQGRYPYDVSKSCSDLIALSYFHTYRSPVAIARCANLFGGGDLNFNRLIPGTIRSTMLGDAPIIRSHGKFVRDYLYVKDAVRGYVKLAERLPDEATAGQAFNFSSEKALTVLDVAQLILKLMHREKLQPVILNQVVQEIQTQKLDSKKARHMLAWRPEFSIEAGLQETIDWYRHNL